MSTSTDFALTRETVIVQLAQMVRDDEKKVERYRHRSYGTHVEGRVEGLRSALFFLSEVPHDRISLLVEQLVGDGGPDRFDAEAVHRTIQQVLDAVVEEKPAVEIPSL